MTRLEAFAQRLVNEVLERWDPSAQDESSAVACAGLMIRDLCREMDARDVTRDYLDDSQLDESAPQADSCDSPLAHKSENPHG